MRRLFLAQYYFLFVSFLAGSLHVQANNSNKLQKFIQLLKSQVSDYGIYNPQDYGLPALFSVRDITRNLLEKRGNLFDQLIAGIRKEYSTITDQNYDKYKAIADARELSSKTVILFIPSLVTVIKEYDESGLRDSQIPSEMIERIESLLRKRNIDPSWVKIQALPQEHKRVAQVTMWDIEQISEIPDHELMELIESVFRKKSTDGFDTKISYKIKEPFLLEINVEKLQNRLDLDPLWFDHAIHHEVTHMEQADAFREGLLSLLTKKAGTSLDKIDSLTSVYLEYQKVVELIADLGFYLQAQDFAQAMKQFFISSGLLEVSYNPDPIYQNPQEHYKWLCCIVDAYKNQKVVS